MDAQAQARFTEANAAFEAQDFARALALYEQALALGLDGPAVHYDIGVAAYRSGDLARAERAFREVSNTPAMANLAHYNLGLVALQRGDTRTARGEFQRVAVEGDGQLAALAARQLAALPPAPPAPAWSLYARGGMGYDDNVALRSESIEGSATGEADGFGELLGSASVSFGPDWQVDGAVAVLDYFDLDDFDQGVISLAGRRGFTVDDWYLEAGAFATQLSLGHDVYESSVAAGIRASRSFSGGRFLQARLRATSVDGQGDFTGLTGGRAEFGVNLDWSWGPWSFSAQSRGELNDSEEPEFASHWLEIGAEAHWALSPRWSFSAGGTLRETHHPAQEASPEPWDDHRSTLRLGVIHKRWKQAQLFARYEYERNSSPLDAYAYVRNWIAASIEFWR